MRVFGLLLLASTCWAGQEGTLPLAGPRWQRGDEIVFAGEVLETSDSLGNRFKKKYRIEIHCIVLERGEVSSHCALLTVIHAPEDPAIAQAIVKVAGTPAKISSATQVRLDLIRVDDRGRAKLLMPAPFPPLQLGDVKGLTYPPVSLEGPPTGELGFLVPMPTENVKLGGSWSTQNHDRPPMQWTATGEVNWNARRCVEIIGTQQTRYFDKPEDSQKSWKRSDSLRVASADGYACQVTREIVRTHGSERTGSVAVQYAWKESNRYVGQRLADIRKEIESAWVAAIDLETAIAKPGKLDTQLFRERGERLKKSLTEHASSSAYRQSLESTIRRCEAIARGEVPYVSQRVTLSIQSGEPLRVGQPAPDFIAIDAEQSTTRFQLSSSRSKPTLLIFYKPGSKTSQDTLIICEALHQHFKDKVTILPLAIHTTPSKAIDQRNELKFTVPVYDGNEVYSKYQVETFPQLFLVDTKGNLRWMFDAGIGREVGAMAKEQLEKCLK